MAAASVSGSTSALTMGLKAWGLRSVMEAMAALRSSSRLPMLAQSMQLHPSQNLLKRKQSQ